MPSVVRLRHGIAVTAAALVVAPAVAHAQGAGDDQYSDPFGSKATPTATPRATATPAPAQPAPAAPATAAAATATPVPAQPAATPAGPTLPYTGVDAWPLALSGALLLGSGVALRLRLREPD
jgi:hypothetical protein